MDKVRVRFAPSPTGYLHIGGARTALFNWLFARQNKGEFILRIEDTDRIRSTEDSVNAIIDALRWLKITWDEGPYFQSKRTDLYRSAVQKLLEEGKAYSCYCTQEDLKEMREKAIKEGKIPKYDGRCRNLTRKPNNKPYVVRFTVPHEGRTEINDLIRGKVSFDNSQLDDLVLLRANGSPTYNLVVVVDDAEMRINYVIRGDDHLANTPKQVLLYEALGYKIPYFAHLPMILGQDKSRLSKRHCATSVMAYKEMGYLPEALVNYLSRLGWSYGDQEIFSIEELIKNFTLDKVGKAAAVFNPDKLLWLNSYYLKKSEEHKILENLYPFLEKEGYNKNELDNKERLLKIIRNLKERCKTLKEMAESAYYFFTDEIKYDENAVKKWITSESYHIIEILITELNDLYVFNTSGIEKIFLKIAETKGLKLIQIAQPVRVALTGGTVSPGIFEVIEILGKERVIKRLNKVKELLMPNDKAQSSK